MKFNLKTKDSKKNKGITLIALVITIIVLLILAGVTIVTLTGDNGLLSKTAGAKEENFKGEEREKIALGFNEYRIKKYTDTNAELTVEGATVTENNTQGWTIKFAENEYTLDQNGVIIEKGISNKIDENDVSSEKEETLYQNENLDTMLLSTTEGIEIDDIENVNNFSDDDTVKMVVTNLNDKRIGKPETAHRAFRRPRQ